jgi:hypothetical protein
VAEILQGWEWNEAVLQEPDRVGLDEGLVSILAFGPDRSPKPIGTAFIAGSYGSHAVAVSAAHNFHIAVRSIQNPNPRHHPTALTEFLPNAEVVDLDGKKLRALYRAGNRCELCIISSLICDQTSDVAIITLTRKIPTTIPYSRRFSNSTMSTLESAIPLVFLAMQPWPRSMSIGMEISRRLRCRGVSCCVRDA